MTFLFIPALPPSQVSCDPASVTFLFIPALHVVSGLFMVFGWFPWFFKVPGWFFMVFLQNVPAPNCILARRSSLGLRPEGGTGPSVFKWVQTCPKFAQMSSNVFKWVQNLFKCVKCVPACPKLVQMCSNVFKNYKPFQCMGSDMTSRA